jgi:hypothetical protein
MFVSIRSKVLQKLVLLWRNFFWSYPDEIKKRLAEKHLRIDRGNVAYALEPKDIIEVIGCSERTAKEYIQALRILMG